jgi:hypothetical protein
VAYPEWKDQVRAERPARLVQSRIEQHIDPQQFEITNRTEESERQ